MKEKKLQQKPKLFLSCLLRKVTLLTIFSVEFAQSNLKINPTAENCRLSHVMFFPVTLVVTIVGNGCSSLT